MLADKGGQWDLSELEEMDPKGLKGAKNWG